MEAGEHYLQKFHTSLLCLLWRARNSASILLTIFLSKAVQLSRSTFKPTTRSPPSLAPPLILNSTRLFAQVWTKVTLSSQRVCFVFHKFYVPSLMIATIIISLFFISSLLRVSCYSPVHFILLSSAFSIWGRFSFSRHQHLKPLRLTYT